MQKCYKVRLERQTEKIWEEERRQRDATSTRALEEARGCQERAAGEVLDAEGRADAQIYRELREKLTEEPKLNGVAQRQLTR